MPRCAVTFWTHPEIIPVRQFFRRWIKSINQSSVDFHCKPFGWLIDWLIDDKLTLTWLVYWICTARSDFTGGGAKVTELPRDNTILNVIHPFFRCYLKLGEWKEQMNEKSVANDEKIIPPVRFIFSIKPTVFCPLRYENSIIQKNFWHFTPRFQPFLFKKFTLNIHMNLLRNKQLKYKMRIFLESYKIYLLEWEYVRNSW